MSEQSSSQVDLLREGYTFTDPSIVLGGAVPADGEAVASEAVVRLPLASMNRHGLVAGATGTGKTVTLQVLAEQLSDAGVPVFLADIKGDLTGLATAAEGGGKVEERMGELAQEWEGAAYPVELLNLGGHGTGTPVRATITAFGPTLLSKVLRLNKTQESSLGLVFYWADQQGLALLDLKDLIAVIQHLVSEEGKEDLKGLGGLASSTAGVILRELIALSAAGGDVFFGEPEFETADLLRTTADGEGVISLLELPGVQDKPVLFSTFLMWLLAELFQDLPEVGNPDKPKLVFFFDEAHLLFDDASDAFLDSVEQAVRLIRSKGVGVFFVTQTPKDVPDSVLAQLGNRVQHALRAHTPNDAKALKATVSTFPTSDYDLEEVLTSLRTGEAVVTVLSEKGAPTPVARTMLRAPQARIGPSDEEVVRAAVAGSALASKYAEALDRESAYELLSARMEAATKAAQEAQAAEEAAAAEKSQERTRGGRSRKEDKGMVEQVVSSTAFRSMLRSAGTVIGREISRSIFGTRRR
ncbi:ATPase component BioM of energizing module of biotin ECF transporter [Serinicoccus hydrothermalis]|uniref:ATPase component BioM of energizing module of biotin ECF transporter n=1 Tax=Serinicoccus hydrothermalis TaxID=1758689 RepID=A0A1B1NEQ9_9MICO|nr:helicase HerA-like domain-containing protein [Serinicoccus hydrothermalis]ANS79909.1 ATPase component BioM of energizing module of biotin ECF transporter [Serinicoccus hydrothermalis]